MAEIDALPEPKVSKALLPTSWGQRSDEIQGSLGTCQEFWPSVYDDYRYSVKFNFLNHNYLKSRQYVGKTDKHWESERSLMLSQIPTLIFVYERKTMQREYAGNHLKKENI